jgi:hypothetical protein
VKKILILFSLIVFFAASCTKYEYGPGVSFRTKKNRISNTWVIDIVKKNGIIQTNHPRFEITIKKDGNISKTDTLLNASGGDSIVIKTGLWEFDNKVENVLVLFADRFGIQESHIWRILKLANTEFWYEEADSLNLLEYRLKEK